MEREFLPCRIAVLTVFFGEKIPSKMEPHTPAHAPAA